MDNWRQIFTRDLFRIQAHTLQLEAFALVIERLKQDSLPRPKLQFVGGCRNKQDEARLQKLKDRSRELNIDNYVEFHRDVMYKYDLHFHSFIYNSFR